MSTSYYRLRAPVTSIRLEPRGSHTTMGLWVNHAKSGDIVLREEEVRPMLDALTVQDESPAPLHTHWGGPDAGAVVTVNDTSIPDTQQVVSEYGDLMTVAEVKARQGARRKDGMPTELFGYER